MKKKFLTTQWIALLCAFALPVLFGACDNPANDDDKQNIVPGNNEETYDTGDEDEDEYEEITVSRPIIEAETSFSLVSAVSGERGALFTFPEEDGPWQVTFANGRGDYDNGYFDIVPYTEDIVVGENIEDNTPITTTVSYAKLVLNTTLDIGVYFVRVCVTGADYSKEKILTFRVVRTPQEFVKAPGVGCAIVSANKNRFEVLWDRRTGADGYRVYIGKTDNSADAVLAADITGAASTSAEITAYPGTNEDFPDGTLYWVWVKAYNASGETKFSPAKKRRTSDPIEAFFYTGKVADFGNYYPASKDTTGIAWDSALDWYSCTPEADGSGVNFDYHGGTAGLGDNQAKILYHARFDSATARSWSMEKYSSNRLLLDPADGTIDGSDIPPAGVFIYENSSPPNTYYATFYYLAMARQTYHDPYNIAAADQLTGNLIIYFCNSAGGAIGGAQDPTGAVAMYSPTLAHAMDNYTAGNINKHLSHIAEPFFRRNLENGGWRAANNHDVTIGWVPKNE